MSPKIYLRILQGGLIASLFIVFFVFKDLLFPYITSKQLTFNVLMEFLTAIWLIFIWRYPQYRPRASFITWGLMAYFIAILASCAVSVDFSLSFWGDAERMLGLFHIFHFLLFYFILITVFQSRQDWRRLLQFSVGIATMVSFLGLAGAEAYSTIGNTAYVSGYLIFNLFFIFILFWQDPRNVWRWLYIFPALIMLGEFWSCHTSGAIIALFASVVLFFILLGLFHKRKGIRLFSALISITAILAVVLIFSQSQAEWFQSSFLRNLTFNKPTFQTRLISWRSAAADFPAHPIFGTGFGNYAIVFDRHFDPKFFNYAKTETYFDRAHNNLIDIASTTGLVGLLSYLSIFAAVAYYLFIDLKRNGVRAGADSEPERRNLETLLLIALLSAYFIQNLAVFDSFVTYIGLMMTLGLIYFRFSESDEADEEQAEDGHRFVLSAQWEWTAMVVVVFIAFLCAYQYNLKPWQMLRGVIVGYSDIMEAKYAEGIAAYQEALSGTPLDHDGAVTFINMLTINPDMLTAINSQQARIALDYGIFLAQKNVAGNPDDSLMQMQLAQVCDTAARFYYQDLNKFNYYSAQAIAAIDKSIAASPGRVPTYLNKAQMQLVRGETKEALETVYYAISLNPSYPEPYCRLAQFNLFLKDEPGITKALSQCIDLGGSNDINSSSLLVNFLNHLDKQGDYQRALKLAERLAQLNDSDGEVWFNLAKLYFLSGQSSSTQEALNRAIWINADLEKEWKDFLTTVQQGLATTSDQKK